MNFRSFLLPLMPDFFIYMTLKRHISIFIFCCSAFLSMQAQDISFYFTTMPNNLLPTLEINRRKDLVDLYKDSRNATVKNALNGASTLKQMTDRYIYLQTDTSSMEMVLLPLVNDSKIICIIRTVCAPVCDSRISFYTTEWKKLDTNDFLSPADPSWFIKDGTDISGEEFQTAQSALDMELMEFHLQPEDLTLVQIYNTPAYLSPDDYRKIKSYLKEEPRIFQWYKTRFK